MNAVYFETSALLAWLLDEPSGAKVKNHIDAAETVVTSVLTLVEAERALVRAEIMKQISPADGERLRGMLARSKTEWILMEISEDVCARASRYFPAEPIRTLDAFHLATALLFMQVFPSLKLLTFDQRILKNAAILGIETTDSTDFTESVL